MSAPTDSTETHMRIESHGYDSLGGTLVRDDQRVAEPHPVFVAADTPDPAISIAATVEDAPGRAPNIRGGQFGHDTQLAIAAAEQPPPAPATALPKPIGAAPVLADPLLALAADVLDDLERVRIANDNRLRQLTRTAADKDGEERGFGLDESHPDVARLAALVASLAKAEHDAELQLRRQLRAHPLGPWVKRTQGVGEKQAARLLAAIRDPYWNDLYDRPRTVSEFWAYAGYHVVRVSQAATDPQDPHADTEGGDPDHERVENQNPGVGVAATPKRGQKLNWSATAKMRTFLIAESCVKQRDSPYRKVYDDTRLKYAEAIHAVECKRCGPSGKPAQPGSALSLGHQHARALRAVSKAVLKDLWLEARRLHGFDAEEVPA